MIDPMFIQNTTACLSQADIAQMIAGAQAAAVASAGTSIIISTLMGVAAGGFLVYLAVKAGVINA